MTVCLGVLCADVGNGARAVVVASDRMVTWSGLTEFEHGIPKVEGVSDRVVGLIAGDALRGAELIRRLRIAVPDTSPLVEKVASAAGDVYAELRREQLESDLFTPRGVSMRDFYAGLQQQWMPNIALAIDERVQDFDYGVELMIAGVDSAGAHLYMVTNPGGNYRDYRKIGFAATGSGGIHAIQSIIGFGHDPTCTLHETLFRVYVSKRRAEVAPGVGRDTDLTVIRAEDGCRINLDEEALEALEKLRVEHQGPAVEEIEARVANLALFPEETDDGKQPAANV